MRIHDPSKGTMHPQAGQTLARSGYRALVCSSGSQRAGLLRCRLRALQLHERHLLPTAPLQRALIVLLFVIDARQCRLIVLNELHLTLKLAELAIQPRHAPSHGPVCAVTGPVSNGGGGEL